MFYSNPKFSTLKRCRVFIVSLCFVSLLISDGAIGRQDCAGDEVVGMPRLPHTQNIYRVCAERLAYPGFARMMPTYYSLEYQRNTACLGRPILKSIHKLPQVESWLESLQPWTLANECNSWKYNQLPRVLTTISILLKVVWQVSEIL